MATLAALARQDCAQPYEVIVVDDASSPPVATDGVRVVRLDEQQGPAAARNVGIAVAKGELLAFTDADCEPEPGWLSAIVAGLEHFDLVQGPIVPARPPGPFDRTLSRPGPSPFFETANLAVRRDLAERLNGFERPGFVTEGHFGEDVVFGWRAQRAGARIAFAPDARVRHAVFPRGSRAYVRERARLALFPPLVAAVPELRRVFLSRGTARFDLAVAGVALAAATRRPLLCLAVVPYARARAFQPRRLHRRSVMRVNLAFVAGDAVGLVALLRGSLRARRLVL